MVEIKQLQMEFEKLKSERSNFESLWSKVAQYVYPSRDNFCTINTPGRELNDKIFDSTPTTAAEMLASGLHGMLTNPSIDWFAFKLRDDENSSVESKWLEDVKDIVQAAINKPVSGFSTNIHEVYLDMVLFGTGCLKVTWDDDNKCIAFQAIPLEQLFISEDYTGRINKVFRRFSWTKEDIEKVFSNVPNFIQSSKEPSERFEIIHCVYNADDNSEKPFKSVYFASSTGDVLRESAYYEMPYLVARWTKSSVETYGRSPAMVALPDIRLLQELNKEALISVQLANRPPLLVSDNDSHYPIDIYPNSLIRYRNGQAPQPLNLAVQPGVALQMIAEIKERIRFTFYNDQLLTSTSPTQTATEVNARIEERMRLLMPVMGRLQVDLLGPLVERSYGLLLRHGLIPQAPEDIDGEMNVEYLSISAIAQRTSQLRRYTDALGYASMFLQIDPSVANIIDSEAALRDIANSYNIGFAIKDHDTIEREREAQAMSRQEQIDLQNQQVAAQTELTRAQANDVQAKFNQTIAQ